ncbi:MAG: hypothetical protein QGI93_04935, partial [Planctomycetota bacterium]|nr:hypothetical protein [Planctomycetota bacterium]
MAVRNQSLVLVLILLAVGTVVGVTLLGGAEPAPGLPNGLEPPVRKEGTDPGALEGITAPDSSPKV